jgi:hypothetical protein
MEGWWNRESGARQMEWKRVGKKARMRIVRRRRVVERDCAVLGRGVVGGI